MSGRARTAGVIAAARRRPRHLVLGGFVAGLLLVWLGPLGVVPAAVGAAALGGRSRLGALAAAAVIAGALVASVRLESLDAGPLAAMSGRTIAAHAILLEPVRERPVGPAVVRARVEDGPGAGEQAVLRVGAYAHTGPWPGVGDEARVYGLVQPLGRFDAYQRRRNGHAALLAYRFTPTGRRRGGLAGGLDNIRRRAEHALAAGLAPPEAALMRGMVLGEDERLSADERADFQRSGLAHILAVSGENVMLLVVLVLGLCGLIGVPLRSRLLLAAAAVGVYVPLAGGGPSIQRAGVMGLAGLAATFAGRPAQRWYALGLAAAATLVLNPRTAAEPGWQLSFAAVVALLVGATPLRKALHRRLPAAVADAAAITLAATLGTAPLMAVYFDQVSLASLPANLLAAPAIPPVMWLGVLSAAAAQVTPALAAPFTTLAAPPLVYVRWIAHRTAALPLAAVPGWAAAPLAAAVLAAVALVWLRRHAAADAIGIGEDIGELAARTWSGAGTAAPRRRSSRRRRALAGLVAIAVAAGGGVAAARAAGGAAGPAPGELVVSFLDVGQGDATLLQRDGAAVLVDTGPPDGPILARLRQAHVKRLDALVLTHAQADHEGAAPEVMRAYPTRLVIDGGAGWPSHVQRALPAAVASDRAREIVPRAGETVRFGAIRLRILWPAPPDGPLTGDPNARAVVARAEVGDFSLLLTADAESDVTSPLDLAPVTALKVAHHGSADPGLPALLARLHPRIAAIEVGRHNTYGHPAPATIAELRRAVPTVVRTDLDGTVRLHVLGDRMWVER